MVYFIGAGPGDPGLLTLRGARCLGRADVVVYDRLVHTAVLRHARPDAERIDVGQAAPQGTDRDAIAYLLLEKVRDGKRVVRLKWGDSFIFDDGGEEALFLHEHGVPIEVVPGIPAAVGVPPYAGVAVTYHGGGDTLTLVRGHEDASGKMPKVDWTSLARLDGTIVCYAGARQALAILAALRSHGRPDEEPVALIFNGTLPDQRTIVGTLGSLAQTALPAEPGPAIVVVGRVAALRQHLRWFDVRPLFGRRVVVTRPREQARELVELFEDQGAHVILAPTVRLAPVEDYEPLDEACANIASFDWVVLPALTGAEVFLRRLLAGPNDVRSLKGVGLCAMGQSSVERFAAAGLRLDVALGEFRPELVVEALSASTGLAEKRVLVVRAEGARDALASELRKAGAEVTEVAAYRTELVMPGDPGEPDLYKMLLEQQIDVVTFASPSTVKEFADIHGADAVADVLRTTLVACVGPVTAQTAQALGMTPAIVPAEYSMAAMVAAVVRHFKGSPKA
ncbi:MAG: uroporphyrinogen-III C-methyltransferase [Acidobacteria bacterium]|nr:uroporphyrinogen-III C-methyltransferase [Acidobacteriota bacterium]